MGCLEVSFDRRSDGSIAEMPVCLVENFRSRLEERCLGELSSRLVDDLESIREGIGFRVADFVCLLARIIGSIIFSFYTGWKLTLVFLAISPLIAISFNLLIRVS